MTISIRLERIDAIDDLQTVARRLKTRCDLAVEVKMTL